MIRLVPLFSGALPGWAALGACMCLALASPSTAAVAPAGPVHTKDGSEPWRQIKIKTLNAGLHHVTAAGVAAVIGVSSNQSGAAGCRF